jgi:hypothetical protein
LRPKFNLRDINDIFFLAGAVPLEGRVWEWLAGQK